VRNVIFAILPLCIFVANASEINLSADDPISYDATNGHLVATGNARLTMDKATIQADRMEYSAEGKVASAQGNVICTHSHLFALADSLDYYATDDVIIASNGRIYLTPITIDALKLCIERQYQRMEEGVLYFGQPDDFSPSIGAKKFEILRFKKVRAKNAVFKVGKIPLFYLPRCTFPIGKCPFWLKSDYGIQKNLGFFLRNNFYFSMGSGVKIGGLLDAYTKRGVLLGPALKVEKQTNSAKIFSESKFGFIGDGGDFELRNQNLNQKTIGKDRFFLESKNLMHFKDRVDAVANLSWLSDSEVVRDFRLPWYKKDQIPDSFVETTYRGDNYVLSAFSRMRLNNFHDTIAKTPELRGELLPSHIGGTNVYGRAYVSYAHLKGKDANKRRCEVDKFDGYCGVHRPIFHGNWLSASPLAGIRVTEYLGDWGSKNYTRAIAQFGFDIGATFTGRSDYGNEVWNIHGIKHTIQPTLHYRYIPQARIKNAGIPLIETKTFDTNLPIIDLADMKNTDDISSQNMFRIGLKNVLQTSTGGYCGRNLLKFDLYQDIRLRRSVDALSKVKEKTLSDTYILFSLYPARWLSFDCYSRINPKNLTLNEITTAINIRDGDVWKLSFLTHTLQHDTCQCGVKFSSKLNSRTRLAMALHYDARVKKFTEQCLSIDSKLGHSWNVECSLLMRSGAVRENKYQFSVRLDLVEF
jgi:lipopolysaccharide assembly outer membrane protein LptD (OstA)